MKSLDDLDLSIPLIVDLDKALVLTDCRHESILDAITRRPQSVVRALAQLRHGRAAFAREIATRCPLDAAALPYRDDLIELCRAERAKGRPVHLVTAADQRYADAVAAHLGLFDSAKGSGGKDDFTGDAKLPWLRQHFPQGFILAGGSVSGLPVLAESRLAILVGDAVRLAGQLTAAGIKVETIGGERRWSPRDWLTELRIHHWSKNFLIFIPLLLGHRAGDPDSVLKAFAAFVLFGLVVSSTYLLNDLVDLKTDRAHAIKRHRPLAAGRISVGAGAMACLALAAVGWGGSWLISPAFALCVAGYVALSLAYSFRLKQLVLLDVIIIGVLFTLRVIMGTALLDDLPYSPWLTSFSICFFYSLALAKRHVEVMRARSAGSGQLKGRGYGPDDWPLTLGNGMASAYISIVIMLLFIALDAGSANSYSHPMWLYAVPAGVFLWTQRIWLLSHRMQLDDDPITFALRDRVSYLIGAVVLVAFALAL